MSSISGIFGNGFDLSQVGSYSPVSQRGGDGDGDNDGSRASGAGKGGMFASALIQALSQIGVSAVPPTTAASAAGTSASSTSTTSDSTSSPTQDPQQALGAFMHDLFAALHAQGGTQLTAANANQATVGSDSDGDNDRNSAAGVSGTSGNGHHHHHHGGGMNGIESKLQTLIQQLASSDSSSTTGSADSTTSALQKDFQNLLSSLGASGNQASLPSFLKAIADNLQGNNPGLNVSAKA